jgi:hypothetical protein
MFSTQQVHPHSYQPINPPLPPQLTDRPMTVSFQDAPFVAPRKCATVSELRKAAEDFVQVSYPDHTELPFHGKRHPYQVAEDSTRFVRRIESEGKTVNKDALYVASLLHDIFYKAPYEKVGFSSREHLAGHRSYEFLRSEGADEEFARLVERTIYATDFRTTALTLEEKVMKAADLFNVGDLYSLFKENAHLLHEEQQLVTGNPSSFSTFVKGAINYLGLYAFREIDASQWARLRNGASEWHVGFVQNAVTLYMEHKEGDARWQIIDGSAHERNAILDAIGDSDTMYIIQVEDEENRERLLFDINAKKREWKLTSPVLVVPPSYGLNVEPMV